MAFMSVRVVPVVMVLACLVALSPQQALASGGPDLGVLDFTWAPTSPEIGQWVAFEITGVPAGDIEEASWDFGGMGCDGSTSWVCTPGPITCDLAAFQYASAGSKTVAVTVTVGGVPQPPVVHNLTVQASGNCGTSTGVTWSPTVPEIGETTIFSITGYTGPVRAEWDFGEDGCPGYPQLGACDPTFTFCHDWAFKFASGGSKVVTVTARDPNTNAYLGSGVANVWVEATGACSGAGDGLFVTQSVYAPGAAGSTYLHQMELFNPDAADGVVRFDWLPRGSDNTVPPLSNVVPVPGGSTLRLGNVLDEVFTLDLGAVGSLRLIPGQSSLQVSNLGLKTTGADALGWSILTLGPAEGLAEGEIGHILFLVENVDSWSNIGCANLSATPVQVHIDLHATDGTWLRTRLMNLLPLSDGQINRVLQDFAPVVGYAVISHTQAGAVVACSGMVVDSTAGDARSEPFNAIPDPGETFYLSRVVHDVDSTTHLALFAPSGAAEARVDFLPTAQNNTSYLSTIIPLADQEQYVATEVLHTLFSAGATGSLRVVATSGTVEATAVETKEPSGTRMYRHARIRAVDEQVPAYHPASIIHLTENLDHRTDIGIANTSGLTIDVVVELREAGGSILGQRITQLLPFSHIELGGIFASVGHPDVADGLARVFTSTPGGSFFAYAVVTDLGTQDSWEMPAELMATDLFADGFELGDFEAWATSVP